MKFQSTHSLRSATAYSTITPAGEVVSIHALLAECDKRPQGGHLHPQSFNPRTPCGVRPKAEVEEAIQIGVSIHALLAECDRKPPLLRRRLKSFNPRTPCGVRHAIL